MMNKFFLLVLAAIALVSCEEDDVCVGEGTPHVTVVFRNPLNTENSLDSLTVVSSQTIDFQEPDTLYVKQLTDSIKLPLGGLEDGVSYFKIKRRNLNEDILTVHYTTKSNYVSKACGFRITYENLTYSSTFEQISNLIPNESNVIENETLTNLYIIYNN